jgi:protein O-mannosyl-transferase
LREKLLLSLAAIAAHGASLFAPFQFDDFALFSDPAITSPSGWWECWRLTQTRPLTWFTFWINYQLGGHNAAGYHAVNLALHVAVVLLVFDVLRRLIPERPALAAAALFAVHPIMTEPVAYVFARGTLLAALFSLLSVRSWLEGRHGIAVGWFAVAMLGKEECAALPVVLLLLPRPRPWRPLAAMFGVALALGLRVVWAAATISGSGAGAQAGISPPAYFAVQGVVILRYLRLLVLTDGLSPDPGIAPPSLWIAITAWVAIAALCALLLRTTRAGYWFVAGLVLLAPSSSIFPAADLAADRRMYLPMVAFCACAALLLSWFDRRAVVGIVIVLGAVAFYYTSLWRNPVKLWTNAVFHAPRKSRPLLQLARALGPAKGLAYLEIAGRLAPDDPAIAAEQGRSLLGLNRPAEALAAFGRALALDPNDPRALNNRGAALLALGQTEAARADFERALARDACLFDARLNLLRMGVRTPPSPACRYTPEQRRAIY